MNDGGASDGRRVLSAACEALRLQLRALVEGKPTGKTRYRVLRAPLFGASAEMQDVATQSALFPQARVADLERSRTLIALGQRRGLNAPSVSDSADLLRRSQKAQNEDGGRLWFALRFTSLRDAPDAVTPWDAFGPGLAFLPRIEMELEADGGEGELLLHLCDETPEEIERARTALASLSSAAEKKGSGGQSLTEKIDREAPADDIGTRLSSERERFFQSVQRAISLIDDVNDSGLQKVVLARRDWISFRGEPSVLLRRLRRLEVSNQNGASYFFSPAPGQCFLGCSPELLFSYEANRLRTEAVAGTRPRGATPREDETMESELRSSPKEVHEHELVVSHIREALQAHGFSLSAQDGVEVRRLKRVMHLVSPIHATWHSAKSIQAAATEAQNTDNDTQRGNDPTLDSKAPALLNHLHPTPALAGSPTRNALDIIDACEGFDRGLYAGPFGFFERGRAQVWIALRGGHWDGNEITLYAGAGIVSGSTAAGEWQETEAKLSALRSVLQEPR